jgi:hypothetical protein
MKRYLTCILAPLLMWVLTAFTQPATVTQQTVHGKDSNMVSVQFSPAQLVIRDNRTTEGIVSIIQRNSDSNAQVATAIEKIAAVSEKAVMQQERRWASVSDRLTQQTGLTLDEVNHIINKKRIFDITFYTIFVLYSIYFIYVLLHNVNIISAREQGLKILTYTLIFVSLIIIYLALVSIVNGPVSQTIQSVINSPPG